jgi:Xaa-Pro aminopeptidase
MTQNARTLAVLEGLKARGEKDSMFDGLLISAPSNVQYLSGFTGSNGLLLVSEDSCLLITDPRYTLQAARQVSCEVRIAAGPLTRVLTDYVKRRRWKRLGFERNRISFETFSAIETALPATTKLVPITNAVEDARMVKSAEEIELIRRSVETNSRAFRRALKGFRAGMRESELAAEIDYQQRRAGAQGYAFQTIVASGVRSALPHARPTREKIGDKGILLIDMGACEEEYASDMTRTVYIGKAPKRFKTLYRAVLEAQLAAIDAVRPGVSASHVDAAARAVLVAAGFGTEFVHSTGHGLGLEIHEEPRIGKRSKTVLQPGFAITIEPGAYIENYGGVRIEDTVIVTEKGCEVLTPTPKDLLEL